MREREAAETEAPLPGPRCSPLPPKEARTNGLGEILLPSQCATLLPPAGASPVAAFAANDVNKVHMREHRVAVHGIRQRVRFAPFERPGGEGRRVALALSPCRPHLARLRRITGTPQGSPLLAPASPANPPVPTPLPGPASAPSLGL